ncbi:transcriptional Fis family isoform B [Micractinium conductrix]|uniref:Transcriptional Fis family isoform A n=1 Tax=Micractinium conductrix TaxID=554055 RepID=A0A2P6V6F6_9CHLO|nr:transcriptional Fis family isoform A [Micractinium conductrix]PSC69673.1 transcriptional Fis family isoform B [Micractinium conductrix]|eukprot:PSC69672.1 transcriptional Fis family isoform A [Micractinium conductrix]
MPLLALGQGGDGGGVGDGVAAQGRAQALHALEYLKRLQRWRRCLLTSFVRPEHAGGVEGVPARLEGGAQQRAAHLAAALARVEQGGGQLPHVHRRLAPAAIRVIRQNRRG